MSAFFVVAAVFFMFPLLSPALGGVVVYPFLLYGLWQGLRRRLALAAVPTLLAVAVATLVAGLVDAVGVLRLVAFALGVAFLHLCAGDPRRMRLLLALGAVHAAVVIVQLVLVTAGFEVDFSELFRRFYGDLLPATGMHIDYNAFSQFDLFVPRVAGLSREPAFASVLFIGLAFVAARTGRWRLLLLFTAALLCTLSKVAFPLLLALGLAWSAAGTGRRSGLWNLASAAGRLAAFVGVHLALVYAVYLNLDAVELAMGLDASFYHRFIGLHTFATQWDELALLGNSYDRLAASSAFQDYEFLADRRAFLDGSVVSKLVVDFGYFSLAAYAVAVAGLSRSWWHAVSLALGGMFINLLSVSPATVLLFWLLSGMYLRPLGIRGSGAATLRRVAAGRPSPSLAAPQPQ